MDNSADKTGAGLIDCKRAQLRAMVIWTSSFHSSQEGSNWAKKSVVVSEGIIAQSISSDRSRGIC